MEYVEYFVVVSWSLNVCNSPDIPISSNVFSKTPGLASFVLQQSSLVICGPGLRPYPRQKNGAAETIQKVLNSRRLEI